MRSVASPLPSVILVVEIWGEETAVTRLVDLGAPEILFRSVVRGRGLAQDLVGVSCGGCGGAGCGSCGGTGVSGRRLEVSLKV